MAGEIPTCAPTICHPATSYAGLGGPTTTAGEATTRGHGRSGMPKGRGDPHWGEHNAGKEAICGYCWRYSPQGCGGTAEDEPAAEGKATCGYGRRNTP